MNVKTRRSEESQTRGWQYDARQECARQLRLMGFSLRQFLTVPYFIQLLISTVLGSVILQALAVHAAAQSSEGHSVDPTLAWTRAGIVGMWSVCIVSAGIINFERFRGTLVYLTCVPGPFLRCGYWRLSFRAPPSWVWRPYPYRGRFGLS